MSILGMVGYFGVGITLCYLAKPSRDEPAESKKNNKAEEVENLELDS